MNDRFKYRYYHEKTNKIYDVCFIDFDCPYVSVYISDEELLHVGKRDFKWKNLIQSTGLKDKNCKLIYEGDIINVKIDGLKTSFIPMVVLWDRKEWRLKQYNKSFKQNCSACEVKTKRKCEYCSQYFSTSGHTNFKEFYNNEVIGNIYENKELLK